MKKIRRIEGEQKSLILQGKRGIRLDYSIRNAVCTLRRGGVPISFSPWGKTVPPCPGEDGGTGAEDGGQLTFFTSMRPKELSFGCMSKVQYSSGFLRGEVTLRM